MVVIAQARTLTAIENNVLLKVRLKLKTGKYIDIDVLWESKKQNNFIVL